MRKVPLLLSPPLEEDPPEALHQELIFRMAALHADKHPELLDLFAIPNGGWRNKGTAAALKRQGVSPGIPDMMLPHARGGWHGCWIELKRFREGQPSPEQRDRLLRLQKAGFRAVLCFGWRMAWQELLRYLALPVTAPVDPPPAYNPLPKRGQKDNHES